MINVAIPNRPFATDVITGLMMPDGVFESALGKQRINAQFQATGAENGLSFYVESVSHPAIVITPATFFADLAPGATRVLTWDIDVSAVPPGEYQVSFIAARGGDTTRVIKKIFVTRVSFDPATLTFTAVTPEGKMEVRFRDFVKPRRGGCCGRPGKKDCHCRDDAPPRRPGRDDDRRQHRDLLKDLGDLFKGHNRDFEFCPPGYLPTELDAVVTPTPPFPGQFGDLPFQDPWWKVILCIIAVILLIAAAIVEATEGSGSITVTAGGGGAGSGEDDCCGVGAEGGGSSYVAAGLVAAAAAVATAAAASDAIDPIRRGQENTHPPAGETTISETLHFVYRYIEPIALGRPFKIGTKWEYKRITDANAYTHEVEEENENIHVLSEYNVQAADVVRVYKREQWIVRAQFKDANGEILRGGELFVQCFLIGPDGRFRSFVLQDDGFRPDEKPGDGIYTGVHQFALEQNPLGLWRYFVIAQDVNDAQPDMKPEEAAQIIGGFVVTHQLTINFDPDTDCPFVPDGHVQVI